MPDTKKLLLELLAIPSPTFKEQEKCQFVKNWFQKELESCTFDEYKDSLIIHFNKSDNKPHLLFVGHTDVVPTHFEPYEKDGKIYGAGSSDMQSGLAAMMVFIVKNYPALTKKYKISFIAYSREENTPLNQNGLFDLLQQYPDFFKTVNLALVGECTNNNIQIGCVGSLHARITVTGMACHSARPWNGENALYKALPLIAGMAKLQPIKNTVFGVDFFNVMQITESESEKGKTSIPGKWVCNINYRYTPIYSIEEAENNLHNQLKNFGIAANQIEILDNVPSGKVIESELFTKIVKELGAKIEAKQAWTDVAQLTEQGIPAFNFGPGLTEQAHKENEYVPVENLQIFEDYLNNIL